MGEHPGISATGWPRQSERLGDHVKVCFHYNTAAPVDGRVVRDDLDDPWVTIIRLYDGRHVLSTECQWTDA
jgi:hypothetical protein